ncbi:hypothetical protein LZ31DRAFT_157861 [Colletotrichum somersetense]|nr:hypothetical protein LZ31DRAFT_157861 [Colletotrichum somersetense]
MVQITTHLARHLEGIALSILSTSPNSEEEMDDDSQLSSRNGSQLDELAMPDIKTEAESHAAEMDVEALIGGITENGRPAELVRVRKDGKAIFMATGLEVDLNDTKNPIQLKRSLSQQLEDNEDIMRNMARRKNNVSPKELGTPKKCHKAGCNKEFKRPCELTKHEKTHFRPWKCPVKSCKYHEYGWPTDKEVDRHYNDKHLPAPAMYECLYKPCPYKSKWESSCKHHMEKGHGGTYARKKKSIGKSAPEKNENGQFSPHPIGDEDNPCTEPSATASRRPALDRTRFTANMSSFTMDKLPMLSSEATNRIKAHILQPLQVKPTLKDFEPIVLDVPRRIREKEVICLRDLENTLIHMTPGSQTLRKTSA